LQNLIGLVQGQRVHDRGLAVKNEEFQAIRIAPKACLLFDKGSVRDVSALRVQTQSVPSNQLVHGA